MVLDFVQILNDADITMIFKNTVNVIENKSNILRIRMISKYGEIYIYILTISHYWNPPWIFRKPVITMGHEGDVYIFNAVIVSSVNSTFVNKWYHSHDSFDDNIIGGNH